MKLVIPLSGQSSRFKHAGYEKPKPLLFVDGKRIIEHVLDIFPGEEDVLFIINEEHSRETDLVEVLRALHPKADIITIASHTKGPVFALAQAFSKISDDDSVFVSYCDYGQKWDWEKTKKEIETRQPDGAVPCYTGFHPHLLHNNPYAGVLLDENEMMLEIKEKHCFTNNPKDSHHSAGSYYFKSGTILKKYAQELMDAEQSLNGEFYVSMLYYLLLRDQLSVFVPTMSHFCQWGTPEDLEEYEAWSRHIHKIKGVQKRRTDIPKHREEFVRIPHQVNDPQYNQSQHYWLEYFKNI